ncbi:hypothetical protein BDN70DRAFT_888534, partial [Pholiota conissans]
LSASTLVVPTSKSCCSLCSRKLNHCKWKILRSSIGMKCTMIMKRGGVKRVCLGRDVDWSIIVYPRDPCTCRIARFIEVRGRVERMVYFEVEWK